MSGKSPLDRIKWPVRCAEPYTLAARKAPVKLNQNENPYELPESIKRGVIERMQARPWSRYPDFDSQELLEGLAAFAGWKPEGILAGNGSNELIQALFMVTVAPDTKVLVPELQGGARAVLGVTAVREVEAHHVHAGTDHRLQHARPIRGRPECGYDLGLPLHRPNNKSCHRPRP